MFSGLFTPIATPFRPDDTVDAAALRRNVERWMRTPLTGLVALGSNGEAAQLDDAEADLVIEVVREATPRGRPLIAGTGRESTRATIAATQRAAAAGVDGVMVRTPSFFKPQMTTDLFVEHFRRVADASHVPVLLYNVTMFTGVTLRPDAVEQLAVHPNIAGMKESGSDIGAMADLVARTPDDFTLLAGSATTFFHALCAGFDGGVLALASLVPDECARMLALMREGRLEEARLLQQALVPLARLIGGQHGVPALKAALDVLGYDGGLPRPPLQPVGAEIADAIRRELSSSFLLSRSS
jgi:4-hydroxy-2-oxoglutarate aldolase